MLLFEGDNTQLPILGNSIGSGKVATRCTPCGTQTQESFYWWLEKVFIPHVNEKRETGEWALLILDNHSSHTSVSTIRWLIQQKIILWFPVTDTTQFTMPLDISVFVALKKKSAKIRRIYYDQLKNYSDQVVPLTMMMVEATFSKRTITRGFIEAGYIRKNDTGEAIPQVFVEALLKHMTPLADLRKEMMEAGKDATSEHPVLVPEAGEALLDSRLKSLKLEKLRRMYDTCFRKGKSSIPKRSACSGELVDQTWADDMERLDNFAKEDKIRQKKASEEAKKERAKKSREKKEETAKENERIKKARSDINLVEIDSRKKVTEIRKLELKLKKHEETIKKLKTKLKKRKKNNGTGRESKKAKTKSSSD